MKPLLLLSLAGCATVADSAPRTLRVATFNVCLNRRNAGALAAELREPGSEQAKAIAEILQRVRPDIVLLNEVDHGGKGEAVHLLLRNYLAVSQGGAEPIDYPHVFHAPSNTGVDSGLDLDNDGKTGGAGDAFGFGRFPGQYAMALLSRFPIDRARSRTFQRFAWKHMPDAQLPDRWYSEQELAIVRLSSKSHWDVVVQVDGAPMHVLCAHPTPPVFDGPEDRNGKRNHDEIRFFADYVTPARSGYIVDDRGRAGGLEEHTRFVILGDLNADPHDGDSAAGAIDQLLAHPACDRAPTPASAGAEEASARQGAINTSHKGPARHDTACFGSRIGNLRLDYVLPSNNLSVTDSGVFWPRASDALFRLVGDGSRVISSDHRLVWCDLEWRK